jgi:8-oxo-dGTP pyrophosphatase MutT (NUDIX family)
MSICDHRCVGALIRNGQGEILLFQRNTLPHGFAGPAGHCDGDSPEYAIRKEVQEEVGLQVVSAHLIARYYDGHPCRRAYEGEPGHDWHFYECEVQGEINASAREVVAGTTRFSTLWEVQQLAERTEQRIAGNIGDEEWARNPGFDLPWYEFFQRLELV